MLKNYLKIALRNLPRHKAYAFINIVGLAAFAAEVLTKEVGMHQSSVS